MYQKLSIQYGQMVCFISSRRWVLEYGRPKSTKMAFININKSFININKSFININKSLININKSFININKWHDLLILINDLLKL